MTMMRLSRRELLGQVLSAAAVAGVLPSAVRAGTSVEMVVTPLSERLTLISGLGGNVTLFNSPQGVLLVDGGAPEHAARLMDFVRQHTGAQVHTLFNTHWHWNQTGSNALAGAAGARIIAHENTRLWLSTDVDSKWEQRVYPPLAVQAHPNQTFYTTGVLEFGGERIDYGHLPQAHTDGDIYVYFRNANVVVAGDVIAPDAWPICDYCTAGWVGGMANASKTLLDLGDANTRFVAGSGRVMTRAEVQEQHTTLVTMRQRLAKLLAQGMSAADMVEARPAQEFEAKYGDASLFVANAWPGLVHRARELGVSIV